MSEQVQVTLNPAPAAAGEVTPVVAPTVGGPVFVTDAKNRRIKLEEPDILAPFRLVEIVGAESAENGVYMQMVFPLLYVTEIDGDSVFTPNSKRELEALIKRLGHEGIKALRTGVQEHFSVKDEEAQKAAVKK